MRKKCLIVAGGVFHTRGGIAAVSRLVLSVLIDEGYDLEILCLNEDRSTVAVPPEVRKQIRYRTFGGRKIGFTLSVWSAIWREKRALIVCDHVNIASILAPLSLVGRACYYVWTYGVEVFAPRPDWLGALGLRYAWRVLAISSFTRDQLLARYPRLRVVTCDLALPQEGDSIEVSGSGAKSYKVPSLFAMDGSLQSLGRRAVLHVGRMAAAKEQDKGQGTLIRAMPRILARYADAQLVLVGEGANLQRLARLAREELSDHLNRIIMPGYVAEELRDRLFGACYLFAMPSWSEGFGLVFIEAMRWAKPCIGSRLDASQCVIRDGKSGLLIENPSSPAEVADRIIWLFAHPARAHEMGQYGQRLVTRLYRFPEFKKRFLKAIGT